MILSSTVYCFWYWLLRHIATNGWQLQLAQNDILKRNTNKEGGKGEKKKLCTWSYTEAVARLKQILLSFVGAIPNTLKHSFSLLWHITLNSLQQFYLLWPGQNRTMVYNTVSDKKAVTSFVLSVRCFHLCRWPKFDFNCLWFYRFFKG